MCVDLHRDAPEVISSPYHIDDPVHETISVREWISKWALILHEKVFVHGLQ